MSTPPRDWPAAPRARTRTGRMAEATQRPCGRRAGLGFVPEWRLRAGTHLCQRRIETRLGGRADAVPRRRDRALHRRHGARARPANSRPGAEPRLLSSIRTGSPARPGVARVKRGLMAVAAVAALLVAPAAALAHPLGNFTVNHYARIEPRLDGLRID